MDRTEEALLGLFAELRDELRQESDVGLALKAQGRNATLRIRSQEEHSDEKRPYFAVVVGSAVSRGAFRVSYQPSGVPLAKRQVTIIDANSAAELTGIVRRYVEEERQRLINYRRAT